MVRRIIRRITAPVRGLHQAAYLLAGLTLASQLLALLRDRIFAHQFGASQVLDVYYAAFKIPDLVFALVASLVSAYVLIPRIAALQTEGDKNGARNLIGQMSSFLLIGGSVLSIAIAVAAPWILSALFPTLAASTSGDQFVLLVRILLVQPILLGLSGILGSVTQLSRRFVVFALSPVLYNLGIILGTVFLYPRYGVYGIGIGVVAGALAHLLIHVPVVYKAGLWPRFMWPRPKVVWSVVRSSLPRSMALAMGSLTALLLAALASRVGEGSVAVLTLATNLEAVPLSLIGAAYATAAFPVLAEQACAKKFDEFRATLTAALRHIIFWCSVITVLTIVLRAYVVRIILGSGAFDWNDTRLTAAILAVLVVGLLAQCIILLAARAFYAANRSWNPLFVQLGDAGVSVLAAVGLLRLATLHPEVGYFMEALLRIEGVPGSSVLFIAMGYVVGQLCMCVVALLTLRVVAPGVAAGLTRPLLEGLGAAILGGASAYGVLTLLGSIAPLTRLSVVFAEGGIAGIVGVSIAFGTLALLENQEFKDLVSALRRISGTNPLRPYATLPDR